ncbi:thioredoxin family protein [Virgibacillus sp. NKC19-16]|uniref:thioredoxin family protein n=1 Tax=Virgibacillus salidurans TaxID=2831673 RepID=UPI001F41E210|nr:thioredoxin family protein [Virgibacillus sp. NKC19-16]UJL45210.1 thioredoxin family protein [Virgibacillus sp. NKC19-16]
MQEITNELLQQDRYLLFIYTPFCGTCHLARAMLEKIESVHKETIFYEMNASLHASFMQEQQIESVPCLLIKEGNEVKEKIYVFYSIANIYTYLTDYKPELFVKS